MAPIGINSVTAEKHLYVYSFHLSSSVAETNFHCSLCFLPNFPSELAEDQEGQMIFSESRNESES